MKIQFYKTVTLAIYFHLKNYWITVIIRNLQAKTLKILTNIWYFESTYKLVYKMVITYGTNIWWIFTKKYPENGNCKDKFVRYFSFCINLTELTIEENILAMYCVYIK